MTTGERLGSTLAPRVGVPHVGRGSTIRVDEVATRLRVIPLAQEAIERALPAKLIADVACASKVVYVSDGAVTHCTATVNDVASGWTLTFRDAAGAHNLERRPGEPWQFANP